MKHIVVAAVVDDADRVLLLRRTWDRTHAAGKWHVLAGHIEEGETPEETLKRELKEELDVSEFEILTRSEPYVDAHGDEAFHVHVFKVLIHQQITVNPDKHDQSIWVEPKNIKHYDTMPYLRANLAAADIMI